MSDDQEHGDAPPNFGDDDENAMYTSALSPEPVDISLSGADDDDEEESPFGSPPVRQKTPTNTTNTVEANVNNDDDDEDPFGMKKASNNAPSLSVPAQVPIAVPEPQSPTPKKQESNLYPTDLNTGSSSLDSELSSSTPVSKSETVTTKPVQKRSSDDTIEITVSDPTKVGDVSLIFLFFGF